MYIYIYTLYLSYFLLYCRGIDRKFDCSVKCRINSSSSYALETACYVTYTFCLILSVLRRDTLTRIRSSVTGIRKQLSGIADRAINGLDHCYDPEKNPIIDSSEIAGKIFR